MQDGVNRYAYAHDNPVSKFDPDGRFVSAVITLGFTAYDTYQFATGSISGTDYAGRMALNTASLIADAATGGLGGGMAVRTAALAARAGRVGSAVVRTAVLVNKAETAVTAVQAGISAKDAYQEGNYLRLGLSAAQIGLGALSLRQTRKELTALQAAEVRAASAAQSKATEVIDLAAGVAIAPGRYRANPSQLRFGQHVASPNFKEGGTIDSLIADLLRGKSPDLVGDPLRVVIKDGKAFSLDNRRLVAFSKAGLDNIPIQVVSESEPAIAKMLADPTRMNPLAGEGWFTVIATGKERDAARQLLLESGKIRGN
ncbi:hypothetical protein ACVWXO_000417 [Bradyrhizobium sp. LM2.7]